MLLKLFLLGVVINAAIEAQNPAKVLECAKKIPEYDGASCGLTYARYPDALSKIDVNDKSLVTEFVKICEILKPCNEFAKCEGSNPGVIESGEAIASVCDIVTYLHTDFAACGEKLEAKNSTCYDNWNPFPAYPVGEAEVTPDLVAKQKWACRHFFGPQGCVKKEIIAECGKEEFVKMSKRMASLNTVLGACTFGDQW